MERLNQKIYRNDFVNAFEGDDSGSLHPRQTPGVFYSKAMPTPVKETKLLAWSDELAKELRIMKPEVQDEIDILGGNLVTSSMDPYAACYAGHQFGNWAGQLGDGRAITLGEWEAGSGQIWELQLKGAGPTPYSRRADGRAVLRSSVREYLMSEAMHNLGVPTTRALSLVSTGEPILRDMFYNGNAAYEPGAIVMRVAPSFLRFGNFEILTARNEIDNLRKLVEWTIGRYYPHIKGDDRIILWFKEVVEKTASLIVDWLRVGFVHGVMNTDNMSILALTIDYGPFSFLDDYDPNFTPNTTDLPGRRYAFGQQSSIGLWNLSCLASAIAPLFSDTEALVQELEYYKVIFFTKYHAMLGNKIGLDMIRETDIPLLEELESMLAFIKPDMTMFFQFLIEFSGDLKTEEEIINHFQESFYEKLDDEKKDVFIKFLSSYSKRINQNDISRPEAQDIMRRNNPRFILRNYLLHQAIEELEKGDAQLFNKLQQAIQEPYSRNWDEFFAKRPQWAASKAGCSMLSCSS